MGFESTLAIIKNTPFVEEWKALAKAESLDPIAKEYRLPFINSLVDLSELFEKYGKESGFYNIALIDLALEFYYYQLYTLESRIENCSVIISDLEINRRNNTNNQDAKKSNLIEKLATFSINGNSDAKRRAIRMNLPEKLISEYTQPQIEYFEASINALWAYKTELLKKFPDRKITFNRTALLQLLKTNHPDTIDTQGNAIINRFIHYIDHNETELEGTTDSLLQIEQQIIENTSIITIDERIEFNKIMMEHRVSLGVDCMLYIKDPSAATSKGTQKEIEAVNSKHRNRYKAYATEMSAKVLKLNDEIDIQLPNSKDYVLSKRTNILRDNIFGTERTPKTRASKSLKNLQEFSDNLFLHTLETEFMDERKTRIQSGLNALIRSLNDDMKIKPVICQSDIIPQYVAYIKDHISYSLGKATDITIDDLNKKRQAILTHKNYALISHKSITDADHILKCALIVGLTIAVIATVTLLSLSLAPSTAHAMSLSAAALAAHASGYVRMAMAAVVAPAMLGGCATTVLMSFPLKQPPMPHDNLVNQAKQAKANRFII